MRQGEITKGKWIGDPLGGVKAPQALILPDPTTRFANTAARLEALSAGHPMEDWLRFMARLARAQHVAAGAVGSCRKLEKVEVERAVRARIPPLSVDGHRRDAAWREALAILLENFDDRDVPAPARAVMASLSHRKADEVENLADDFLHRGVNAADAGAALYVAAAIQVYFTHMAAALPEAYLRLLPQRGLCPCCGSTTCRWCGDCNRPDVGDALFILFALRDGLESRAGRVHHVLSGALGLLEGNRWRFGSGQGRDVR